MYVLIAYLLGILTGIKRIDPVNKANNSQDQSGDSLPVLRTDFDIPTAVQAQKKPKDDKKNSLDFYLAFIHTATMLAVVWYACINSKMLDKMKESTGAATASSNTAQKQLEMTERPWISVKMTISSPFVFDVNGAHVGLKVAIKNIGHSPAVRIWPDAELVIMPPNQTNELTTERNRFCAQTKVPQEKLPQIGDTLFPDEPDEQEWELHMKRVDIERASNREGGFIMPVIIACVPYHSTFNESTYLTAKIREVVWITEEGRGPVVAFHVVDNGATPINRLDLFSRLFGANYAE